MDSDDESRIWANHFGFKNCESSTCIAAVKSSTQTKSTEWLLPFGLDGRHLAWIVALAHSKRCIAFAHSCCTSNAVYASHYPFIRRNGIFRERHCALSSFGSKPLEPTQHGSQAFQQGNDTKNLKLASLSKHLCIFYDIRMARPQQPRQQRLNKHFTTIFQPLIVHKEKKCETWKIAADRTQEGDSSQKKIKKIPARVCVCCRWYAFNVHTCGAYASLDQWHNHQPELVR